LNRTFEEIRFSSEKPPAITGIPSVSHDEMRLKLETVSSDTTIPPGLNCRLQVMMITIIITQLMQVSGMEV
jgi:hypothetical protein